MPAAPGVSHYVNRNSGNAQDEKPVRGSPSTRGSAQTRQVNNSASLSLAERQRKAANARVPIPATYPIHLKMEPETDVKGLESAFANRPVSVSSNRGPQPRNIFDDTDLDDTVSSGLSTTQGGQRCVPFTTDYKSPFREPLETVDVRHYEQHQGGYNFDDADSAPERLLPENWREMVRKEKNLQAGSSRPSSVVDDLDDDREEYFQEGQEYDDQDTVDSRGRGDGSACQEKDDTIPHEPAHHDVQVPEPTASRTRSNHMAPPPPPLQAKVTRTSTTTSIPTSKSSSYVEGSDDEVPPFQPAAKKARVELDYDPQVLKRMTYADLDKEPFEKDPRAANTTPPVDEHGMPLTLHRRLGNLSRMKEEDVRAMFLNQKDQEWEDTGAWFMSQFRAQMIRLMETRQERRMIASKFEMEVKQRQAAVAARTGDVEQELRYLKTGGKDLMKKRVSPMK